MSKYAFEFFLCIWYKKRLIIFIEFNKRMVQEKVKWENVQTLSIFIYT